MIYPAVCAIHRLINWGLVFGVFSFRLEEHKLGLERERSIFIEENSIRYDMITLFREGDAIYLLQFSNLWPSCFTIEDRPQYREIHALLVANIVWVIIFFASRWVMNIEGL